MRGFNLSDKPPRIADYNVEVLVEDVLALIKNFGADCAAVVGHDWGAAVAWAVAQKYPQHVSRLAALQVPPAAAWRANMTLRQLLRSWYMFFFQLPAIPEWAIRRNNFASLDRLFTKTVVRNNTFSAQDIAGYKKALQRPGAVTAAVNYYRANVRKVMVRRSKDRVVEKQIAVPTLFIFAEQDFAILPATAKDVNRFVNAPYHELRIADSGHWVQNEAAEEVNHALLDFLAEN
jgi:pimeloyl-ACP methyl ester carboxylesterase